MSRSDDISNYIDFLKDRDYERDRERAQTTYERLIVENSQTLIPAYDNFVRADGPQKNDTVFSWSWEFDLSGTSGHVIHEDPDQPDLRDHL